MSAAPASTGYFDALRQRFVSFTPHIESLGMSVEELSAEGALVQVPFQPHFIGDASRGVIHNGVITTLIDTACGLATLARLGKPTSIATLDLRVDYLRAAVGEQPLHCRAACYRLTPAIAFLRARVWQQDEAHPVAESLGTFMINETRKEAR